METGKKAPDFALPDQHGKNLSLKDGAGKWIILYFYPKDDTPGCTLESIDFTKELVGFKRMNTLVWGVSPDSPQSHCDFTAKHGLGVTLLSDESKDILKSYGVWQMKSMYGKEFMGVVRTTFLIDPRGIIRHVWEKVNVPGHVEEVKSKIIELQNK